MLLLQELWELQFEKNKLRHPSCCSETSGATSDCVSHPPHCCSVTQSCLTLQLQGLQHARLPCPSPPLRVCSNLCPSLGLSRGKAFGEDSSALGTKKPVENGTWGRGDHGGGRKERKEKWTREEGRAGTHTDEQQMGEARKPYHILFRSWDPGRTWEWTRVPGREGGGGEFCAYLPRILLTQPWLTRSWREMSQGLTPWWARSTMR